MDTVMEDRRALVERLIADHSGTLREFLRRRVSELQVVDDLLQEVFLRMLRLPAEREIQNPAGYMFTVADNLTKEHLRNTGKRAALDIDDPLVESRTAQLPDFGRELDEAQRVRRLREVLGQLSPKCQTVVALRYWQGQSYEEIAQQLDISANMVKKYLSQALVHCRRRMQTLG
jgi:RNA polymerase sigma-70 factor (ECF subfamily)